MNENKGSYSHRSVVFMHRQAEENACHVSIAHGNMEPSQFCMMPCCQLGFMGSLGQRYIWNLPLTRNNYNRNSSDHATLFSPLKSNKWNQELRLGVCIQCRSVNIGTLVCLLSPYPMYWMWMGLKSISIACCNRYLLVGSWNTSIRSLRCSQLSFHAFHHVFPVTFDTIDQGITYFRNGWLYPSDPFEPRYFTLCCYEQPVFPLTHLISKHNWCDVIVPWNHLTLPLHTAITWILSGQCIKTKSFT